MSSSDYFNNLTHSVATSRLLLQKAHKNEAVIEGLCLYVSIIDAFLRLAIIYTRTQKAVDHTYKFDANIIYQRDGEKIYFEKEIYQIAHNENIIAQELYDRLVKMYEFRNKVIHRFNISNITYEQIAEACSKFEVIYKEVFDILSIIENGPKGPKKLRPEEFDKISQGILKKAGSSINNKSSKTSN